MMKSERFQQAFIYAYDLHADQKRKGKDVPYISHLMGVADLVLEYGGTENQGIAALLHDAVEDQGGRPTLDEIRKRFGDEVAQIVDGCTEERDEPDWRKRKERHIAHIGKVEPSVRLVAAADKLHNVRAMVADYRTQGENLWKRFNKGKEDQVWYYRTVAATLREIDPSALADELGRVVSELEQLVREADSAR